MLIIGEKLNSAIPGVRQIMEAKDAAAVQDLAVRQAAAGVHYLDVNTAHCGDETAYMEWLVRTVQEVTDTPLCIDSTDGSVIRKALEVAKGNKNKILINSISMEKNRLDQVLPLVLEYQCPVIGLTVDDNGIPKTVEDRISIAGRMVDLLAKEGYNLDNLYIDPLVLPLAVSHGNALIFFECLSEIKRQFKVKTVSGLSNISFNMPKRKIINRYFLAICMAHGMDAAILDPLDKKIMTAVTAVELLMGKDPFGKNFLKAYRKDMLED
ncbi:methyltetrahydrofolate cobalamin methyltransferase [Moorella sulfitireducens (nom. illeg.)]|uniref:methyltetrahydrofolate cobalamin methyltransferase n=1 Tax=Neomoorella sulfitireducens TaxID=2972948 RepID=UPI0021AD259B|nr:methyltetrahydrofolate cobalamin methyltransferase [Moorella sulfitireducens]